MCAVGLKFRSKTIRVIILTFKFSKIFFVKNFYVRGVSPNLKEGLKCTLIVLLRTPSFIRTQLVDKKKTKSQQNENKVFNIYAA